MRGLHLTADLHRCAPARPAMTDAGALRETCLAAIDAAGLTPVAEVFHRYAPAPGAVRGAPVGITGVVLLAESHLAVHTWPELAAATLDVYVCNLGQDNSGRAHVLLESLIRAFEPERVERRSLDRGEAGQEAESTEVTAPREAAVSASTGAAASNERSP